MKDQKIAKKTSLDIALAISVAAGVTAGVIISLGLDSETLVSLSGAAQKFELASSGDWLGLVLSSLPGVAVLMLVSFLCGFSAVSQPFELMILAFRGVGLGVCVRGIYLSGEVFRSLMMFLPYAILSTGILVVSTREAVGLSMRYFGLSVTNENRLGIKTEIRDYSMRFLGLAILLTAFSMLDALLCRYVCNINF